MDALTHGLIGLAIGNLSGQPLSYNNPIYLAAFFGSLAPDLDIVAISREVCPILSSIALRHIHSLGLWVGQV